VRRKHQRRLRSACNAGTRGHGGKESDALAYWRLHIGNAFDANVIEKSPARAAARTRAPILLLHGVDDTVVPVTQAEAMARALQEGGKPHTLSKLPGEDHWLSRSEMRVRVLRVCECCACASAERARDFPGGDPQTEQPQRAASAHSNPSLSHLDLTSRSKSRRTRAFAIASAQNIPLT
jgi:acetyl esterase/lipase